VSVVSVEPNIVTRLRTPERDGYAAVQLGIEESGRLTKPEIGQLKNLPKLAVIREFRLDDAGTEAYTVGQKLDVTLFTAGDVVDVVGVSKARAFPDTSSAITSSAVPRPTVPTTTARPARSARHHAGPRLQGHAHGRPPGRRPRHRQEAAGRPCGRRAQPAAREGSVPGSPTR